MGRGLNPVTSTLSFILKMIGISKVKLFVTVGILPTQQNKGKNISCSELKYVQLYQHHYKKLITFDCVALTPNVFQAGQDRHEQVTVLFLSSSSTLALFYSVLSSF